MRNDTDTIKELYEQRGELMMRAGSLCGRVMALSEIMGEYLREMEASPKDPAHLKNLRHIRDSLNDALNDYNDPEKPF